MPSAGLPVASEIRTKGARRGERRAFGEGLADPYRK